MSLSLNFTGSSHQTLEIDFRQLAFSDEDPIAVVILPILTGKYELVPLGDLPNLVASQTGCSNVGELRRLTDQDWKRALEIPCMLKYYLKKLIAQAGRIGQPAPPPEIIQADQVASFTLIYLNFLLLPCSHIE